MIGANAVFKVYTVSRIIYHRQNWSHEVHASLMKPGNDWGALISCFNFWPRYDIVFISRKLKLQHNYNKTVITNYFGCEKRTF